MNRLIGLIGRIRLILCGSGAVRRQPLPGLGDGLFGDSLHLFRSRGGVWRDSLLTAPSLKDAERDLFRVRGLAGRQPLPGLAGGYPLRVVGKASILDGGI